MTATSESGVVLEARGLTRRFGGLTAVRQVDLDLRAGEALGLIGPNGAGKTTLFNLLAGQLRCDEGAVRLLGTRVEGRPAHRICRMGLARTFQVPRPFLALTVSEAVLVGARFGRPTPGRSPFAVADDCLERTGLASRSDDPVLSLNLADRKRLDLARAIASNPQVLLVDEAAAGLNPTEVREIVGLLRDVRASGVGIVYVEHVMEAVLDLSDRVQVLDQGATIAVGSPEEVTRNPVVVEAYLGRPVETLVETGGAEAGHAG